VIRRLRGLLFLHSKREIWNRAISKTQTFVGAGEDDYSTPPDLRTIVLNRKKASEAKTRKQQLQDSLLGQLYSKMKGMRSSELRCQWCSSHNPQPRCMVIKLHGEGVVDLGGPYRAVLVGLVEELKSGVLDLLCPASTDEEDEIRLFRPGTTASLDKYLYFFGKLIGVMIRCNIKFPLDVPTEFWKLLVGDEIDGDWENVEDDIEEEEEEGKVMSCDGSREYNIRFLRQSDKKALRHVRLHESRREHRVVLAGMSTIVPLNEMRVFTWFEAREIVCGVPDVDIRTLKSCAQFEAPLNAESRVVSYLWRALERFSPKDRVKFLKFVFASSRLPNESMPFRIQLLKTERSADEFYPNAQTCFFTLKIPDYSSEDTCYERLRYAVNNCVSMDADVRLHDGELWGD